MNRVPRIVGIVATLLLVATMLGVPSTSQAAVTNVAKGTLSGGGAWATHSFYYPGNDQMVAVTLSFTPADAVGDLGVVLEAFNPKGTKIGVGSKTASGKKYWQLASLTPGNYTLTVRYIWDPEGRPLNYTLSSMWTKLGARQAYAGPPIGLKASSEPEPEAAPAAEAKPAAEAAPAAEAKPAAPAAEAAPVEPIAAKAAPAAVTRGSKVSNKLAGIGDSQSYSFYYPGNDQVVSLTLRYTPDDGLGSKAIIMEAFNPKGTKIAVGSRIEDGRKYWQFANGVPGNYRIVIRYDWHPVGGEVSYALSTSWNKLGARQASAGPELGLIQ